MVMSGMFFVVMIIMPVLIMPVFFVIVAVMFGERERFDAIGCGHQGT